MKRIAALFSAALISIAASDASAQTFTYQSQGDPPTTVGTTAPNGTPITGSYLTGNGATAWADGKKSKYSYKCVSTTQPPNNTIFMAHMICDVAAVDGNFTATFGCNPMDTAGTEVSCIGGLYGKTGRYSGHRGTLTNHRKGETSGGTGEWY
jgi:hypothetical protein